MLVENEYVPRTRSFGALTWRIAMLHHKYNVNNASPIWLTEKAKIAITPKGFFSFLLNFSTQKPLSTLGTLPLSGVVPNFNFLTICLRESFPIYHTLYNPVAGKSFTEFKKLRCY